jgi:hypothetical protein
MLYIERSILEADLSFATGQISAAIKTSQKITAFLIAFHQSDVAKKTKRTKRRLARTACALSHPPVMRSPRID